jgi:hypothetical protein
MVAVLQLGALLLSAGDLFRLGEAYAFGVTWTFVLSAMSIYRLRRKKREPREYRVPLNIGEGWSHVPLGILLILLVLLAVAGANLFTNEIGTISGAIFVVTMVSLFTFSESQAQTRREPSTAETFNLIQRATIDLDAVQVRAAPVLVGVRDVTGLAHLELALRETDTEQTDIVVMTARIIQGAAAGHEGIFEQHLFTEHEQVLFTEVVSRSEKCGKPLKLLVVPSNDSMSAILNIAIRLGCARVYLGASEKHSVSTQARLLGEGWEEIDEPDKAQFELVIVPERGRIQRVQIGAHAPELAPEDIELTHDIWLEIVERIPEADLHHRDVVSVALRRFREGLRGPDGQKILEELQKSIARDRGRRKPRRTPF